MIKISNLSNKKNGNSFSFSDLHLDLEEKTSSSNKQNDKICQGNDIILDTDENAIKNSVINLLFQKRYLNPNVNLAIRGFIGTPVTEGSSQSLGDKILKILLFQEPRIKVEKVLVAPSPDSNQYNVVIIYTLVNFSKKTQVINGILDSGNGVFTINNLNN